MRIIVHLDDLADMHLAMQAVRECETHDYRECGFGFGFGSNASAFVRRNKTGWTACVTRSRQTTEPAPADRESLPA